MHHYIPVKRDLSNLIEKIIWAKENDDVARKISHHSQQFVNDHLTPDKVFCYQVILFKVCNLKQFLSNGIEIFSLDCC